VRSRLDGEDDVSMWKKRDDCGRANKQESKQEEEVK